VEQLEERNLLTFYGGYRTVDELYGDLGKIAASYPQITELVTYGQSYSKLVGGVTTPGGEFLAGYDLETLEVTNKSIPGPKPVFVLTTGMHSREISGPEVIMRYVDWLTQGYGTNADATWLVDYHDIWIVPSVNPDGHWYVELGTQPPYSGNPFLWRKNGHPTANCGWPPRGGSTYGIDLNRNFDDHWGGIGASSDPCSEIYHGPSVASEPESAALQTLISGLIPVQRGPGDDDPAPDDTTGIYIDVHTYGGLVLWPWGHTPTPPPNSAGLTAIGRKLATYNHYRAGQSYQTLYPTSGIAPGFVYGKLGSPAYTFELDSATFLDTYDSIDSRLWPRNRDAFIYASKIARTPYMTVQGPDSLAVTSEEGNSQVIVHATIDHTQNANRNIAAAEFYIDAPPFVKGAAPIPMDADDGDFDMPREAVSGSWTTNGLDPGQHTVFVRGLDVAGNWGPISAAFFDVVGPSRPSGLVFWSTLGGYRTETALVGAGQGSYALSEHIFDAKETRLLAPSDPLSEPMDRLTGVQADLVGTAGSRSTTDGVDRLFASNLHELSELGPELSVQL
jgi:hypothetical protein